jgi:PAS domain S-box-containing protein
MVRSSRWRTRVGLVALVFLWQAVTPLPLSAAETNGPVRHVLVLHSFGREFAPFSIMSATFRTELARQSAVPVEFYEASIEMARFSEGMNEQPVADYLQALFKDRRLDLIVAMGGPATLFVNRYREQLFPEVPLVATMDQRRVNASGVSTNMTVVTLQLNLPGLIEDILQVRPATTNVIVVFGVSPFERYWAAECEREFAGFTNRVTFTSWNDLSLEAMTKRAAYLPPNSAIWYGALVIDAAGVPHEQDTALVALHASANAPIFGVFEHQLGLGIVGGRLTSNEAWGRRTAEASLRILNGEPPGQIHSEPTGPEMPAYDWRELQRWGISHAQLPRGSVVRFRPPSLWESHKDYVIGGLVIFFAQAMTIVALLVQRSRRRLAEATTREDEKRMALAADAVKLGLWVWDMSRNDFWVSGRGKQLFGYPPDAKLTLELLGARIHAEDRPMRDELLQRALAGTGDYDPVYRVQLPDGAVRWVATHGHVEFNHDGEPILMRGVSVDITERKQAEQAMEQQRSELTHLARVATVNELSSSLAHELNQPLGIILSNAQAAQRLVVQEPPDLAEVRDILADIVSEDQRASEVIKRLRSMLKPGETGPRPLDVNAIIEDALRLVSSDLTGQNVAVQRRLAASLPHILGDPIQLQQVLINLILNACDAMAASPPGRRQLTLATAHLDNIVCVSVSDMGCGLPPDVERVFKPFYTTKQKGLGLGLAICRSIVTAHKGRLWAEAHVVTGVLSEGSAASCGATFHLELPAAMAENGKS